MYLFFSCTFFFDFRFSIFDFRFSIFDFWFLIFNFDLRFLFLIFNFYLLIYYIQARALIRTPKLLLLDEAISALNSIQLESESEKIVQFAIDKASRGPHNRHYCPQVLSPLTLIYIYIYIYIYEYIYIYFEDSNSSPASRGTVPTAWESSHSTHPPASPNFPQAAQQALTYHNHFTHSTLLTLTTGDVSHYHLLRHTQPRVFINQSRCPSTSRPHQSHDCSTRLTVQEPRPPPHQPACFRPGRARVKPMETIPSSSRKFTSPLLLSLSVSFLPRPPRYLVTRVLSSLLFSLLTYIQA